LHEHKFPNVSMRVWPAAPKGASQKEIHKSATRNHAKTLRWFLDHHPPDEHHVIVCEDDCEFMTVEPAWPKIIDALQYLDAQYPEWTTFHVGHCPLAPLLPTSHPDIVHTILPYTAHCYAMNGRQLRKLFEAHPNMDEWTRPQAIEGWCMVPWKQKFALYPTVATQNRMPKEVNNSQLIHTIGLNRCLSIVEETFMYGVPAACLIVLVIVLVRLLMKNNNR